MEIKAKPINAEGFAPFGSYFNIYDADTDKTGDFSYYPDLAAACIGNGNLAGFSVCGINKRDMSMDVAEMHEHTEEVEFFINGMNIVLAGERSGPKPDLSMFKAFIVPAGTLIRFKRYVWHFVPFPVGEERSMVLTSLPPFTYTNDAVVEHLAESIKIL